MLRHSLIALGLAALAWGCLPDDAPRGLRATPAGSGPRVVFDLHTTPLPDVPFPNDLLARADGASPTGIRLNLSQRGPTALERRLRQAALELDGFSPLGALTVRFDRPLDLAALVGQGREPAADPVLVICLEPGPGFGERIPLDLGRGLAPASAVTPDGYFHADPRAGAESVLFETVDEDRDGDGRLGQGEDTDGDGVLDRPNVASAGADPAQALLSWYERETDTLILRPLIPLRPGATYAVVLTDDVRGEGGAPIRSPFEYVHHIQQAETLIRLPEALAQNGRRIEQVAFAWTFTTQTAPATLMAIRAGLHGEPPYQALADAYPAEATVDRLQGDPDQSGRVPAEGLVARIRAMAPTLWPTADAVALAETYDDVAHLVAGRFGSPALLVDDDGHAGLSAFEPADQDEAFRLDPVTGAWTAGRAEVPFWCVVPRATPAHPGPFPVVIQALDVGQSRADVLVLGGVLARAGLVTCAVTGFGQGLRASPMLAAGLDALDEAQQPSPFRLSLEAGRARDLDADGQIDPDGDAFGASLVHGRDVVRQSAVDLVQFVRVLRGFDGVRRWNTRWAGGVLAGDFDGDGQVDFGGPDGPIHIMGQGFGGNLAVIVAAVEPSVDRVAALSAGAGLADILARTGDPGLRTRFWLPLLGPLITGRPADGGGTIFSMLTPAASRVDGGPLGLAFADGATLAHGDQLVVTNLANGQVRSGLVGADGTVRVGVPADALDADRLRALLAARDVEDGPPPTTDLGDPLVVTLVAPDGRERSIDRFERSVVRFGHEFEAGSPLVALASGYGLRRQSPRLRRFAQMVQTALDPADPGNYAAAMGAGLTRDALFLLTAGDPVVPVSAGLALTRAAGLVDEAADQRRVAAGVVEGLPRRGSLVDPDALSAGAAPAERLTPPIRQAWAGPKAAVVRVAWLGSEGAHGLGAPQGGDLDPWLSLSSRVAQFLATGAWTD